MMTFAYHIDEDDKRDSAFVPCDCADDFFCPEKAEGKRLYVIMCTGRAEKVHELVSTISRASTFTAFPLRFCEGDELCAFNDARFDAETVKGLVEGGYAVLLANQDDSWEGKALPAALDRCLHHSSGFKEWCFELEFSDEEKREFIYERGSRFVRVKVENLCYGGGWSGGKRLVSEETVVVAAAMAEDLGAEGATMIRDILCSRHPKRNRHRRWDVIADESLPKPGQEAWMGEVDRLLRTFSDIQEIWSYCGETSGEVPATFDASDLAEYKERVGICEAVDAYLAGVPLEAVTAGQAID